MTLSVRSTFLMLAFLALSSGACQPTQQVFVSPGDDGVAVASTLITPGENLELPLWIRPSDPNSLSPAEERCSGRGQGTELCMWEVEIRATGNARILSFEPAPDTAYHFDAGSGILTANGGNTISPSSRPEPIGVLEVSAAADSAIFATGRYVSSGLALVELAATPIATFSSAMPTTPAPLPASQLDDRCGDIDGNRFVDLRDPLILARASVGLAEVPVPQNCAISDLGDCDAFDLAALRSGLLRRYQQRLDCPTTRGFGRTLAVALNPTDSLALRVATADGSEIEVFTAKNAAGLPTALETIVTRLPTGEAVRLSFDEVGELDRATLRDTSIRFEDVDETRVRLVLSDATGLEGAAILDLTTGEVVPDGAGSSHARPSSEVSAAPVAAAASSDPGRVSVDVRDCDFTVEDADVEVQASGEGRGTQIFPAREKDSNLYVAHLPVAGATGTATATQICTASLSLTEDLCGFFNSDFGENATDFVCATLSTAALLGTPLTKVGQLLLAGPAGLNCKAILSGAQALCKSADPRRFPGGTCQGQISSLDRAFSGEVIYQARVFGFSESLGERTLRSSAAQVAPPSGPFPPLYANLAKENSCGVFREASLACRISGSLGPAVPTTFECAPGSTESDLITFSSTPSPACPEHRIRAKFKGEISGEDSETLELSLTYELSDATEQAIDSCASPLVTDSIAELFAFFDSPFAGTPAAVEEPLRSGRLYRLVAPASALRCNLPSRQINAPGFFRNLTTSVSAGTFQDDGFGGKPEDCQRQGTEDPSGKQGVETFIADPGAASLKIDDTVFSFFPANASLRILPPGCCSAYSIRLEPVFPTTSSKRAVPR